MQWQARFIAHITSACCLYTLSAWTRTNVLRTRNSPCGVEHHATHPSSEMPHRRRRRRHATVPKASVISNISVTRDKECNLNFSFNSASISYREGRMGMHTNPFAYNVGSGTSWKPH